MTKRERPGMQTVRKWLARSPEVMREATCLRMAAEIRAEINGLRATMHDGPVSARPGKYELARREAHIDGMKWMLALALGLPWDNWRDEVDTFLEEFKAERLNAADRK